MKRSLLAPSRPALLAALAILSTAAVAGPYDQPWTVIETDPAHSPDANVRPVAVSRVDGQDAIRNRVIIEPGPHMVTVDLPPRKGFSLGTRETFDLTTSPCMRYYIAAKLDPSAGQHWKPIVRHSELIGECATKFRSDKPAK